MLRENSHPLQLASNYLTERHPLNLDALQGHPAITPAAREQLLEDLQTKYSETVMQQVLRLVITDFHAFREANGWPPDPKSRTALRAYARHLRDRSALEAIWAGAPRLPKVLDQLAAQASGTVLAILDNFLTDRAVLVKQHLVQDDDLISRLALGEGDTHAGGKAVAIVTLTSGTRLVYKPRSLEIDEHLPQLFALLDSELEHSLSTCIPQSLSRGDHGWQQFIDRSADLNSRECEAYYYRFGALTAIAGLWGSTDLHHENVIVHGATPVVIDGETVLQPDVGTHESPDPRVEELLKSTPIGTLLLPIRDSASVMDVLLSGLGVPWEQTSQETVFQVADRDTDAFSIQRSTWSMTQAANVPTLAGIPQNPVAWYSTLKRGYLDGLDAVRRKEQALAAALRALPETATVRYVFRATEVYGRFLDALTHGDQWGSMEAEDAVLDILEAPRSAQLDPEWLVDSEREQLRRRDVPLFNAGVHDTHAIGTTRSPRPLFTMSAVEAAIQRTRRGLELREELHLLILETCCSELGRGPEISTVAEPLFRPLLNHLEPNEWQGAVAGVAMRTIDSRGHPDIGWCGGTGLGDSTMDVGLSLSFHDMGGPAAFLRRYHLATGLGADDQAAAERGWLRRADFVGESLEELPWSVLGGSASIPLILGAERGITRLLAVAESHTPVASDEKLDVAHGSAGTAALLSHLPQTPGVRLLMAEHADRVWDHLKTTADEFDHNLLHGRLGLWWAILRAGRVLHRSRWVAQAREWLEAAATEMPPEALRGWCNGAAGVAMASHDAGVSSSLVGSLIDRAVLIHDNGSVDLSVCHGEAGIAQVIAWIDHQRGLDPGRARDHLRRAFQAALSQGFHTGMHGHTALLGYAMGWSGVADTVLLASDTGSDLAYPVALESDLPTAGTPIESWGRNTNFGPDNSPLHVHSLDPNPESKEQP